MDSETVEKSLQSQRGPGWTRLQLPSSNMHPERWGRLC